MRRGLKKKQLLTMNKRRIVSILFYAAVFSGTLQADTALIDAFGGWAEIGRPDNAAQGPANRNHTTSASDGLGSVGHVYWIGKHQVTIDDWSAFYSDAESGRLGTFNEAYNHWNDGTRTVGGGAPAVNISFHQAAQYCNWLTSGNALEGAYQISASGLVTNIMSRADILATGETYYVLPTLNEWFKAAYFHQDTQTYSRYAHGEQTIPPHPSETEDPAWSYRRTDLSPQYAGAGPNYLWEAGSGGEEISGTFDMMGNVWEWIEDLNGRQMGGGWLRTSGSLDSARGGDPYATQLNDPKHENSEYGFRVVAVPPAEKGLKDLFGGWIEISSPGNAAQSAGNRDHDITAGDGFGAVDYIYHIAKNEVSVQDWSLFYHADSGRSESFNSVYDHWNGGYVSGSTPTSVGENAPAVNISFHQAAQYCNWLTTGSALEGAYTINDAGEVTGIMTRQAIFASGQTYYVLPKHDEWYKAAYYDEPGGIYFLYSNGSNSIPEHGRETDPETDGWNYRRSTAPVYVYASPNYTWETGSGGEELNRTVNMTGNVWEWMEDIAGSARGGAWNSTSGSFFSGQTNTDQDPALENPQFGLRVVALSAAQPSGRVREPLVNPYSGVHWESDVQVQSVSHCHLWWDRPEDSRERFQLLYDRGIRHFPFSNYYPSEPMYPLEEFLDDLPEDILGGPNAEHHNATDHPVHFNSLGSFFSSGSPSGQSPRGLRIPWRDAFDQALNELQFEDGGGITINHPVWTGMSVEEAVTMFDYDERVLGIEVFNWSCNLVEKTGWALDMWDEMLATGRNVLGFWVPDHPRRTFAGRNVLLLPEFTEHAAMRAYRTGAFYGALYGTSRFTNISVEVPFVYVNTDHGERIRFISQEGVVDETEGPDGVYRLTGRELYLRIEADAPDGERLFSQPIIFPEPVRLRGSFESKYRRYQKNEPFAGTQRLRWEETAWKGERIHKQIVLWSDANIDELKYIKSALENESGFIPASAVQLKFGRYVKGDPEARSCSGYSTRSEYVELIDALSEEAVTFLREDDPVKFWIGIDIPSDAAPGTYHGSLTVEGGSVPLVFSMEVEVVDYILPEPADREFHLDLWQFPSNILNHYNLANPDNPITAWSDDHFALLEPAYRLLADSGQKAITAHIKEGALGAESMVQWIRQADGSWVYDFTAFDRYVSTLMSWGISGQISCFSPVGWNEDVIPYRDQASGEMEQLSAPLGSPEYQARWDHFLTAFKAHLDEKGWFEKTVLYLDEVSQTKMNLVSSVVQANHPDWKLGAAYSRALSDSVKAAFYDLSGILEVASNSGIADGHISTFYTSCTQLFPNSYVTPENSPAEMIWMGWHAAREGYDGYLRWAYDNWRRTDPFDARDGAHTAGDFAFVYRSSNSAPIRFLPSLRLIMLREGIQDFEKIRIIKESLQNSSDPADQERLEQLMHKISGFERASGVSAGELVKDAQKTLNEISLQSQAIPPEVLSFEEWMAGYGLSGSDALPDDDFDGDGFTNRQEYIADTDPARADSFFYVKSIAHEESQTTISFRSSSDRMYELWFAADLTGGIEWERVQGPRPGTGSSDFMIHETPDESVSGLYRLRVSLP